MRTSNVVKNFLKMGLTTLFFTMFAGTSFAAILHVNSNADTVSFPSPFDANLTLREAIQLVNGTASLSSLNGLECGQIYNDSGVEAEMTGGGCTLVGGDTIGAGDDTIVFDFASATTIEPLSLLPIISADNLTISGENRVALDGSSLTSPGAYGLKFQMVTGGTVKGMTFQNFSAADAAGLSLTRVENMQIGTFTFLFSDHNHFWNNTYGIFGEAVELSTFENNFIGNNGLIVASNETGFYLTDSESNLITGNYIGGNADVDLVLADANDNEVSNNYINAMPTSPNTPFLMHKTGIIIENGSDNNQILNNYFAGLELTAVLVDGAGASGNVIRFNRIAALGTGAKAIELTGGANGNVPTPTLTYPTTRNNVIGEVAVADGSIVDIYVANNAEEAAQSIPFPIASVTVSGGEFRLLDFPLDPLLQYVTATVTTANGTSEFDSYLNDTDGDGVTDEREDVWWATETDFDPDGDGLDYFEDADADGDGINDGDEDLNGNALFPYESGESSPVDPCDPDDSVAACTEDEPPVVDNDTDDDGIDNNDDNCPTVANADQADADGDGDGDACDEDLDTDSDGIDNAEDNCPLIANADQADSDADGVGDACDEEEEEEEPAIDTDLDGVADDIDNCPLIANASQADSDSDHLGDACDPGPNEADIDHDFVMDGLDNCLTVPNTNQLDENANDIGDACEPAVVPFFSSGGGGGSSGGGGFTLPPNDGYIPLMARNGGTVLTSDEPIRERGRCTLVDIYNHWSNDYVNELCELGIVSGYGRSRVFGPDNFVTRAEFIKMLLGAMNEDIMSASRNPFSDVSRNEWYGDYIYTAKELGIVEGYSDNTFKPGKEVSRAEAVKMVLSAMGENPSRPNRSSFNDVPLSHWGLKWIEAALDMDIVSGKNFNTFAPDSSMTRGEASKVIVEGFLEME